MVAYMVLNKKLEIIRYSMSVYKQKQGPSALFLFLLITQSLLQCLLNTREAKVKPFLL